MSESLNPELTKLRDLTQIADRHYEHRSGEPENVELRDAIAAANDSLQIVCTLVSMQTAARDAARWRSEADRATNLHSTLRDLLIEQRAIERTP